MNRVFREEKKYLISLPEALQACHRLAQVMHEDPHNGISGYPVRSLYFDTLDDRDFHEKAAGVELRRKLRLRCYDPAGRLRHAGDEAEAGASQLKRSLRVTRRMPKRSRAATMRRCCGIRSLLPRSATR